MTNKILNILNEKMKPLKDEIPLKHVDKIKLHFLWDFNITVNQKCKSKLNLKNKW